MSASPAPSAPAASITADLTVNEVLLRAPATQPVFTAHGIDSCCGGARTLADVAQRHGLDLPELLAALGALATARDA
jgi:regulator of cell morphogenesis and NO signaling